MINPQFIKGYVLEKLECDYRLSSNDQELIIPSVFIEGDYKRHMSINLESGLWQCFKTGNTGNFIKLYSLLEGISYKAAESKLLFQGLESGMWDLWEKKESAAPSPPKTPVTLDTEGFTPVNIDSYDSNDALVVKAWTFLMDRKLLNTESFEEEPYYVAIEGKYQGRLIIPFKDYDGEIFFFQGRSLSHWLSPKYLNPTSENGVKSSNILYPFDFEAPNLCICEGPLDAISLNLNGLNATCTIGSSISDIQMQILREFEGEIILAYDNDEAGARGIEKFDRLRKNHLLPTFSVCNPPEKYKDWNDAYVGGSDLDAWVKENKYEFTFENKAIKLL